MFLLDTNVVSELRKSPRRADTNVSNWVRESPPEDLFLSAIVIEELEIGVLRTERRDPRTGAALRAWLIGVVLATFAGRILPVDTAVARRSAALHVPDPAPVRDGLIAATALVYGMTLVTRNVRHFERSGAMILNPWRP